MVYFFIAATTLIIGYFTYGKLVENIFGADDSIPTPAVRLEDALTLFASKNGTST